MTPLSNTKLSTYFAPHSGGWVVPIQFESGDCGQMALSDHIELFGWVFCTINGAEDLQAFISGIKAKIIVNGAEVNVSELTDEPMESDFVNEICRIMEVDQKALNGLSIYRGRQYVTARYLHMIVRCEVYHLSLAKSAAIYGKDHATALHGKKTINNLLETDSTFRDKTARLFDMIRDAKK